MELAQSAINRLCAFLVVFFLLSTAILNVAALQVGPSVGAKDHTAVPVTVGQSASSRSTASRSGPNATLFKNPPNEDRVLPIQMSKVDQAARNKYNSLGVGGMVVNSWNWDNASLADAKAKNWTMWVNDYYMYPSGNANPLGGVQDRFWNPGFETHRLNVWPDGWQWTYSDWPRYDFTGQKAHSGQAAIAVDSMNFFYWPIAVKPGYEYNISAWARQDTGGESGYFYIMWFNFDQMLSVNITQFQTGTDYKHYSILARAPPTANVGRIFIQGVQRYKYVWFDDVMIRKVDKSITNAAVNPGFESHVGSPTVPDGWIPINSPVYDKTGIWAYNGSCAVKVNVTNLYVQIQPVVGGKDYYMGQWMVSDTGTVWGQLAILWLKAGKIISVSSQGFLVNDIWGYYDFMAQAPADADSAGIAAISGSNSYMWVDDVTFFQSLPINDGVSRGPILDGHPELEAQGLYYSFENVMALGKSNLTVPSGTLVLAVAAPIQNNGALDLSKSVDLTATVVGGKVVYTPTSGYWRVMAFSYDILMNGTEVDPAITNMHQINVMNKVAVQRFIEVMYNQTIFQKTSKYWGNMIKASWSDEVSNLAGYFLPEQYPVVAWLHDDVDKLYIEDSFKTLHGYNLVPELPALWNDVGPKTAKYRTDFYNTTGYLEGEAYYRMVGEWCAKQGINFSGHLLGEDSLIQQVGFYGNYFESSKYMGYPGFDALIRTGSTRNIDIITEKMAQSTAVQYGKPHTQVEYSVATSAMNYRQMTAVANWEMVQGADRINSFAFYVGYISDAELKAHSEQVGRSCYMLQQGKYSTQIAVLYPITSIQAEYVPTNSSISDGWRFAAFKHDQSFQNLTLDLLKNQMDFIYFDDDNILSTTIDNSTGTAALHHGVSGLDLKVLVVPEMNVIKTKTMERIKAFYDAGGIVVAIGDLPTASAENGTDPYITSLVNAVFDMGTLGPNGYNQRTNANGGVSIRGNGKESALESPLRAAMQEDLLLPGPVDPDIYYLKRTAPDFDVYMLVNNGAGGYWNDTKFRTLGDPSLWDPETGDVTTLSGNQYSFDAATGYTTIKFLAVYSWSSVFIVFKKPVLKIGPADLTLDPKAPLLGDKVTVGVNISNIGDGVAPQVKIRIYDGDPDNGGILIGTPETMTIGPQTKQHIDHIWDTSKSPGLRQVVAVACLPDNICVRTRGWTYVNTPPKAAILVNKTQAYTFDMFNFSSNSTDVDGPLKNISWDLGDGTKAYTKIVTHGYKDNGTYDVSLTVIDSNGTSNRSDIKVTVLDRPPVANFTVTPGLVGNHTTVFFFNATGSTDRDGSVVSYVWTFGDGSKVLYQGKTINYTYDRPGKYNVSLTITDNDGSKAQMIRTLTINNLAPTTGLTFTPSSGNVTTTFKFNSTAKDPDGTVVTYNWSFGDGTYSDKAAPEHKYLAHGTFKVVLRVRDDLGAWSANVTKDVVVTDLAPVAKASPATQTIKLGVAANFTSEGTTDLDDKLSDLKFDWDFGDGSAHVSGAKVSYIYPSAGEYNVTLKVSDPSGLNSTVKVHVTVQKPVVPPKPKPKPNNNNATAGIIALVIIIVAALGIGAFLLSRRGKGKTEPVTDEETQPTDTKDTEPPKEGPKPDEKPEEKEDTDEP